MDSKKQIKIFLRCSDGKQRIINIEPDLTVKKMIEQAQLAHLINIESLTFKGKNMKKDDISKKLNELGIKDKSVIQIVSKLTGGQNK